MTPTALERLAAANPVLAGDVGAVVPHAWREALLLGILAEAPPESPRRRRVRAPLALAFAAGLALAVAVAASALGFGFPIIDFFRAEHAPVRIVEDFQQLSRGAPVDLDPAVIASEARRVTEVSLSDGPHTLWVSPTKDGGYCAFWSGFGGGCDRLGTTPVDAVVTAGRPYLIAGQVSSKLADSVLIRFADGGSARPEMVWVSAPINAGFFLYEVPSSQLAPGGEPVAVVALATDGTEVAEYDLVRRGHMGAPPPLALLAEARRLAEVSTADGPAELVEAPSSVHGRCAWVAFRSRYIPVLGEGGCLPEGYEPEGFVARFVQGPNSVLLVGSAGSRYTSLDIRYEDGSAARINPVKQLIFFEVPASHFAKGHRVVEVTASDRNGQQIMTWRIPNDPSVCLQPFALLEGQSPCGD